MKQNRLFLAASFFLIAAASRSEAQTTVTLTAVDSKSVASVSNTNWNDNRFRAYWNNSTQGFVDGFVKFDLSTLPSGAKITDLTMRTYHEFGFGNPFSDPEVRIYRVSNDGWMRGAADLHPGLNEILTPIDPGPFPIPDLTPYDWNLDVAAADWSLDIADGFLSLGMRNEAGAVSRYSYVYWYGSDGSPAPPELIVTYRSGPVLSVMNLVAGATATATVDDATPGGAVYLAYSAAGAGPSSATVPGCGTVTLDLSPPYTVLPPTVADGSGTATFMGAVPPGTTGITLHLQGFDYASCSLTNALTMVIG